MSRSYTSKERRRATDAVEMFRDVYEEMVEDKINLQINIKGLDRDVSNYYIEKW